jgi:hypothetical protein
MGIMAQCTSSDHHPVAMFAFLPLDFFTGMTGETCVIDFALAKTYLQGISGLLVTDVALLVGRSAMLPCFLVKKVNVAHKTRGLLFKANQVEHSSLL